MDRYIRFHTKGWVVKNLSTSIISRDAQLQSGLN